MRLLLDTHALIWAVDDPTKLGTAAFSAMADQTNELLLSAATIWELSIKVSLGKLNLSMPYRRWMETAIADLAVTVLPITVEYADAQVQLQDHHGDPFDRLLAAQTLVEGVPIVSADAVFDHYAVTRIW